MRNRFILFLLIGVFSATARAAVLPPEKLLPKDTVLVVTLPDSVAGWAMLTNSPYGRLWQDAALKPFKDKFIAKFSGDVLASTERSLGTQFSSFQGLAQGQATFALIPMAQPTGDDHFDAIFILDTKDKAAQLRTNLAAIRQKWAADGKPMKTEKIRDLEFITLIVPSTDLAWLKIFSKPPPVADVDADKPGANKVEITIGQSDSLLFVSDSPHAIEKVLARQSGGLLPALEEQPAFQADFVPRLRGKPFYAWGNIRAAVEIITKSAGLGDDTASPSPLQPDSLLVASGLTGLTSASFSYAGSPEGLSGELFVGVPESKRRGLLKAFVFAPKDANPPSFVPADAVKFWRWRLDVPHSWSQVEEMLNDFNPQYSSLINFILQTAGKDKDEKYDLKSELLSSLGDDIIHYEKVPRGNTLADLNPVPSIYLIGSPNADKLAAAIKNGLGFMGVVKDREFLGRQISTLSMAGQGNVPAHSFSFSASGSYVGLSDSPEMLEEYLRSNDSKNKSLSETPGLAEAAQKVGGMGTGLFGFDSDNLSMRSTLETLRQQPVTLQDIIGASSMMGSVSAGDQAAKLREWADFSLLPPFDGISQYFYFSVFAGSFSQDGFSMKFFSPTPPKLR